MTDTVNDDGARVIKISPELAAVAHARAELDRQIEIATARVGIRILPPSRFPAWWACDEPSER